MCNKKPLSQNLYLLIDRNLITTANTLEGYRITKQLGLIRGITVRSRSILGNLAGGLQSVFGGELSVFVELCEKAREDAYEHMIGHANEVGANAIICMRYDTNDVLEGITEVLAYGTAVVVERV
jgi:uncharacterized protein YbjQ (UPF0145 family)